MGKTLDITNDLKGHYFWDVDIANLDPEISGGLIIERVFLLGDVPDIRRIIDHYGEKKIVNTLCKLNYLDPKTLNFVSKLFQISPKKFKCYTQKQSNHQHWNS